MSDERKIAWQSMHTSERERDREGGERERERERERKDWTRSVTDNNSPID